MAQAEKTAPTSLYRSRRSFAKIPDVMDVPNLIAIQTESFKWFTTEGLDQAYNERHQQTLYRAECERCDVDRHICRVIDQEWCRWPRDPDHEEQHQ